MKTSLTLLFSVSLLLVACDRKPDGETVMAKPTPATTNLETTRLGTEIDRYIAQPTAQQAATVDKAFADLDGEIAELDQRVTQTTGGDRDEAQAKATNLKTYRAKEQLRFTEAKARAATEHAASKTKDAGEKIADGVKDAAETVKDGVNNAVDTVKEKLP